MTLKISPSVGVSRLGSSKGQFCLSPDKIGGLPFEADKNGNKKGPIIDFKDDAGQVRRQGQLFRVFNDAGTELTLDSPEVESIEWTVHLANKKAAWYQYSELEGNLLYGEENSYKEREVPLRNPNIAKEEERQKLIIDPGPRTVTGRCQSIGFDAANVPASYKKASYPPKASMGTPIETLGELRTDSVGRLIVIGGFGHAGGNEPLTSYGGSNTWHDDISDGPVYCTVTFKDKNKEPASLGAWVIVGSPDFAPEIVNISTLSDTMFDVGVRKFDLIPEMCEKGKFKKSYEINYQRDILPIIQRLGRYQWVANVQSMMAFTSNVFDFSDPGKENKPNRENYFSYFRKQNDKSNSSDQPQQQLYKENGTDYFPMIPLNSGSNSVSNETIVKFLALNETQYFLLSQWAEGNFVSNPKFDLYPVSEIDQASVGNCVGLPMCPGIEVTWSLQNENVYSAPFTISDQKGKDGYNKIGLTPSRDECEGRGCEPGDLTKRMACPWQADFFQCTIQYINFTDPKINKDEKKTVVIADTYESWEKSEKEYRSKATTTTDSTEPLPPSYYTYWWPPQSPWDVIAGEHTLDGQQASHVPVGQQMNYARGINSFVQMVEHWSALAFIRDNNSHDKGFPYFSETERNNELFTYEDVPVGRISGNFDDNETTIPVFFIESDTKRVAQKKGASQELVTFLEEREFKPIKVSSRGLGLPRSGTRNRR